MDLAGFYEALDERCKEDLGKIVAPLKGLELEVFLVDASEGNGFTNVHLETVGDPSFSKSRLLLAIVQMTQQGARIHTESASYDRNSKLISAKYTLIKDENLVVNINYVLKPIEHIDLDHYVDSGNKEVRPRELVKL